jgi:hypothetical protein
MTQSRFLRVSASSGPCFPGRCTPCCRSHHFRRHPKQSQLSWLRRENEHYSRPPSVIKTSQVSVTVGSQGGDHAGDLLAGRTLGQGKCLKLWSCVVRTGTHQYGFPQHRRSVRQYASRTSKRSAFIVNRMDCQICLQRLSLFEPIYRMGLGPAINGGFPTSVCERCLDALIGSLKRPDLRDGFHASKPCEICERPVYDLKGSKVTRVVCSPECRDVIDSEQRKRGSRRSAVSSQV